MLSNFSGRSLIVLCAAANQDDIVSRFLRLRTNHFPDTGHHILRTDISWHLRLLMRVAHRVAAPYDLLLRIDLHDELNSSQHDAVNQFREQAGAAADRLSIFRSNNFQFHNLNPSPSDVAMAFINTWPTGRPSPAAQEYWRNHHGPLVQKIGLPPVITSYTQVQFDDTFDNKYQGLSFETIRSQRELSVTFASNAALRRLNKILLEDEEKFTGPPRFFAFETVHRK